MRATISRLLTSALTSPARRGLARWAGRMGRPAAGPTVDYFHQADDPYSHLACQTLGPLARRYQVRIRPWLVPPPDFAAAPEQEKLRLYGLRDAVLAARHFGLEFPASARLPSAAQTASAQSALAAALAAPDFADRAVTVGKALWSGAAAAPDLRPDAAVDAALAAGAAERNRLGHYLGAMLHFEGEWYWGVDRLHHLEVRLAAMGRDAAPAGAPRLAPWRAAGASGAAPATRGAATIELWFSFRSPYSWIAFPQMRRLARLYGARLQLRPVLPMVMRGLPVPRIKRAYIVTDAKREADLAGLPFGPIVDPVGAGVERAIAVLAHAAAAGLGEAFAESALRGAWAEGVDLAADSGLAAVAGRAGIGGAAVAAALADESWRAGAEANRAALFEAGLWGVPSFRLNGGPAHWGQDRLWAAEDELRAAGAA